MGGRTWILHANCVKAGDEAEASSEVHAPVCFAVVTQLAVGESLGFIELLNSCVTHMNTINVS